MAKKMWDVMDRLARLGQDGVSDSDRALRISFLLLTATICAVAILLVIR